MPTLSSKAPSSRLRFIDMARSIAILLMLEGHFIDVALNPEWRKVGHLPYEIWFHIRGMAAPMFFTGTGLVFAYLLNCRHEEGFWRIARVRKGLLRAAELIFWGYLLQVDLRYTEAVFRGDADPWLGAFHVLQCIGVGLLIMIAWFGLLRRIKLPALGLAYCATAFGLFLFHLWLGNRGGYFPATAPAWIQNMIKGPHSVFPMAPWLGFTLYGAAIGVWVRRLGSRLWLPSAPWTLIGIGLILRITGMWLDRQIACGLLSLGGTAPETWIINDWFHSRLGEVLIILGMLVAYEIRFQPGDSWFLTIGRNTFPIYVAHVIILYGGISGIGLRGMLEHRLNLWQSLAGALLFMALFAWMVQWIGPTRSAWHAWIARLRTFSSR